MAWGCALDLGGSRYGPVVGSSEDYNETLWYIKGGGEPADQLGDCQFL
jgi:hypothetical protein